MIGKQIKGTGFRGCLNYVLGKKDAALIGGTMCGQTPEELAAEFFTPLYLSIAPKN